MTLEQRPEVLPPDDASATGPAGERQRPAIGRYLWGVLREVVATVLPALVIVVLVNMFLGEARRVEMQSMEPNLHENQRLIIEKVSYYLHPPQRGDIVVLRLPSQGSEPPLIKRVIGLPGETVEIKDGLVYINAQPLNEPYLNQGTYQGHGPYVVPENQVFVLGDNRGFSNDSRYFGYVPYADIIGRAWFRYWPLPDVGFVR